MSNQSFRRWRAFRIEKGVAVFDVDANDRHKLSSLATRERKRWGLSMRASLTSVLGAAVCLVIAPSTLIAPAQADPAYSAKQVIDIFAKDIAAAEAAKADGKSRSICVGTAADCPAPPVQSATRFDLLVNFEFNSDKLTRAARDNLDQFAKALLDPKLKGQKFEIDGHTDATGAEDYNFGLSERRANAVVAYLAAQGIDPANLVPKGFGKTKPRVADPYSPENRRVETHLME
jgi:outer membrane protein OmpA-like peptidoglycan-associated protein